MVLIFGGAYQGKLEYAQERFGIADADIYHCTDEITAPEIPRNKKIINCLENWILALVKAETNVSDALRRFIDTNPNAIVICTDISCGIVPMSLQDREWREAVGRSMAVLSKEAEEVVRIFCGIPTVLKPLATCGKPTVTMP